MPIFPLEADPVLIVYPDRVLPISISRQSFEHVVWRRLQVVQRCGSIHHQELSPQKTAVAPAITSAAYHATSKRACDLPMTVEKLL